MSQIGNKLRAGFFATPPRQGDYLRQLLAFPEDTAVLDPTCGEGKILRQLTENRDTAVIKSYGVELDKRRALIASEHLDEVIQAPIESMVISNDAYGLIFLNPPYDHTMKAYGDEKSERKEYTELVRGTRYLAPGGVLMYIIPSYRFSDKQIARFLATNFDDIEMTRFTDEDYPDFRQCIFIGKKKESKTKKFNERLYERFLLLENETFVEANIKPLDRVIGERHWTVPATKTGVATFYTRIEDKNAFIPMIRDNKGFAAFMERTKPKTLTIGGDPIINIAQGQMALLLASGAVNGLIGEDDRLHVVQGMEVVTTVVTEEKTEHSIITKSRTKREVSVKIITPKGIVRKLM